MFGLAHQIPCHGQRIGAVIGQHQAVGGACHHIDAHRAKQLALGLGHIGIAGAHQNIGGQGPKQAIGHGGNALHAPDGQHPRGPGQLHGVKDGGGNALPGVGHRTGGDMGHTGHLCGGDRHQGAGDMGIAPAWHIGAHAAHWNNPLARAQAGAQFDLHLAKGGALGLGKAADVVMGIGDIVFQPLWHLISCGGDGFGRHLDRAIPAIQLLRIAPRHVSPALADLGQHALHGFSHVVAFLGGQAGAGFEGADGHWGLLFWPQKTRQAPRRASAITRRHGHFSVPKRGFRESCKRGLCAAWLRGACVCENR